MGKIVQIRRYKYHKSKTTKAKNGKRRCKSCGRFL